ncbi:MAG: ABC-2 transporter permease [Bacillaceae bacterium]|nr:ABC-2 transporter permease [Bacillaceae bacterium]
MGSLIAKDFLVQKRQLWFSLFYYVIFMYLASQLGNTAFILMVVMITFIFTATSAAYDDKSKSDILLNSLPVRRNQIVLAKYLSFLIASIFHIIVFALLGWVINQLGLWQMEPVTWLHILIALLNLSLLNGIYLPVYFRFGYIKSRILQFVVFFTIFSLGTGLGNYLSTNPQTVESINHLARRFLSWPDGLQVLMTLLIVMSILLVSFLLSAYFYGKREF